MIDGGPRAPDETERPESPICKVETRRKWGRIQFPASFR